MDSPLEHRLKVAHKHSSAHRDELISSAMSRCFYFIESFKPSDVQEWVDEQQTAMCPRCGIDSVIGNASEVDMGDEFFRQMKWYWFDR